MKKSEVDVKKRELRSRFNQTNYSGIRVEQAYGIYRTIPGRCAYVIVIPQRLRLDDDIKVQQLVDDLKSAKKLIKELEQIDIKYEKSVGRL